MKPRTIPPGVHGDELGGSLKISCSHCGARGHNRRTCPKLRGERESAGAAPLPPAPQPKPAAKRGADRPSSNGSAVLSQMIDALTEARDALDRCRQLMGWK